MNLGPLKFHEGQRVDGAQSHETTTLVTSFGTSDAQAYIGDGISIPNPLL